MQSNIPGWPRYHITKEGIVYCNKMGKWEIRKSHLSKSNGYIVIRFRDNGSTKLCLLHRLVAMVYVPNPNPEFFNVVCHKDNNPKNNHYKNLYWGTQKMNMQQMVSDGRFCSFNMDEVRCIRFLYTTGLTCNDISNIYGTSRRNINYIIKNKHYNSNIDEIKILCGEKPQ